eukprot:TRINITY_DN7709_c0_g1_i1.p1 TRINITY_DN7709_c0_g1~~TRINITY_DN7709_c0_g1_i1.p1  ORF type:complete len:183 (-),score=40.41 TRINITY_DN7709_c0_g1_i1:509-994(-)
MSSRFHFILLVLLVASSDARLFNKKDAPGKQDAGNTKSLKVELAKAAGSEDPPAKAAAAAPAAATPAAPAAATKKPERFDHKGDDRSNLQKDVFKNPKAPSQGYSGEMVRHVDGQTYVSDWGKETPAAPVAPHRYHRSSCASVSVLIHSFGAVFLACFSAF